MKLYHKIFAFLIALFLFTSCDKFVDVNENVNAPNDVSMDVLLTGAIERTSQAQFYLARQGNIVTQHIGKVGTYPERISSSAAWSTIYLNVLDNAKVIENKAGVSPHYMGVAEVIEALNIGQLTDYWEDAVYSEGFQATNNFTPKYDSQASLYDEINRKLNSAIAHLEETESDKSPKSDDLIYGGDLSKWIKLAYTLKARYAIHLSNKGIDANAILANLEKGITSNADNFQLSYSVEHKNYWHSIALNNETGNLSVTQGDYLIESMKAMGADGDPRLPMITKVPTTIDSLDGKSVDTDDTYNTDFSISTWHSTEGAPNVMVSFAEAKFIEAEAALDVDKGRAYSAYIDGIKANMNMLGVDDADIASYLEDPSIDVGEANLTLSNIMLQKYFAMYLTTEAWVDMRRHHYDAAIYPGFVVGNPFNQAGPLQRLYYPDSEFDRNGKQVKLVKKDDFDVMWRDQ